MAQQHDSGAGPRSRGGIPHSEQPEVGTTAEDAGQRGGRFDPLLGRAEDRINEALRETADRIQSAAERLGDFAGDRFSGTEGAVGRAGDVAHSIADALERIADAFRSSDLRVLRDTVERSARARPVATVIAGVAAGWVVGKLVR
jgi:hypothetical protein